MAQRAPESVLSKSWDEAVAETILAELVQHHPDVDLDELEATGRAILEALRLEPLGFAPGVFHVGAAGVDDRTGAR